MVAVGSAPDAKATTDVLRTHTGRAAHWSHQDITVGVDDDSPSRTVPPEGVGEALQAAVDAWNEIPELPLRFSVASAPNPAVHVRFCRGTWQGDIDDLGKAVFNADLDTGVISSAVVEINECDRSFVPPDQVQDGHFDLQAVLTHELGHVLGLGHSHDPTALMFPRGGTAGIRSPKADDRAGIALIYGTALASRTPMPALPVSPPPAPSERAAGNVAKMPPDKVVTAMRVASNDGQAVIVYTCEPTLLPPTSPVATVSGKETAPPRLHGRRNRVPPAHTDPR